MRSWLLVPADGATEMEQASASGADAIVLDLHRQADIAQRDDMRAATNDWLNRHRKQVVEGRHYARWVRISPLDSPYWRDDLLAVMGAMPDGIFLPQVTGPAQVQQLGAEFYEMEQIAGITHGSTRIIPMLAGDPAAALHIAEFARETHPRLAGLAWDAAILARQIGVRRQFDGQQEWCGAFAHIRAQLVLAARANDVQAIESCQPYRGDEARLGKFAQMARADGFTGMFASSAQQVGPINAAFTPTDGELAEMREREAQSANQALMRKAGSDGANIGQNLDQNRGQLGADRPYPLRGGIGGPRAIRPA